METKTLLKQIGALAKTIVKMVATIQTLAIECVMHAIQHGNVTPATQLIEACGKGIRRQSLVAWFERNGPFKWDATKMAFSLDSARAKKMREVPEADMRETLADKKWEEAKPEGKLDSIFDVEAQFDAFLRKVTKLAKEGKVEIRNKDLFEVLVKTEQAWHDNKVLARIRAEEAKDDEANESERPPAQPPAQPPALLHTIVQ